ncbi:MAG: L-threonylcarbamoyladenylate synthase [Candidatus Micrarchaeota archaeon]|nr:L-threonylcarbamoyladenylate synthase [Candidatus Micrarchaeota archaeon]
MKTKIIRIEGGKKGFSRKLMEAAEIIKKGGLVAFPTETVYGLGADALNPAAVEKIFLAKKRPRDDPLIVHVASIEQAEKIADWVPEKAKKLMRLFWPGPLTLVLAKKPNVPSITTGGLETVAIRMPRHPIALGLIKAAGTPIAAPSANLFGKPSPTSASHVLEDLGGRIDAIIDGGSTEIGIESTVLDMTASPPVILRPGGITLGKLKRALGRVEILEKAQKKKELMARSPGTRYRHYAPKAKVFLLVGNRKDVRKMMSEMIDEFRLKGKKFGVILTSKNIRADADVVEFLGEKPQKVAKRLFAAFRKMDKKGVEAILTEGVESRGLGIAIMNRMKKAAFKTISKRQKRGREHA